MKINSQIDKNGPQPHKLDFIVTIYNAHAKSKYIAFNYTRLM
jgi:hypothetical protein